MSKRAHHLNVLIHSLDCKWSTFVDFSMFYRLLKPLQTIETEKSMFYIFGIQRVKKVLCTDSMLLFLFGLNSSSIQYKYCLILSQNKVIRLNENGIILQGFDSVQSNYSAFTALTLNLVVVLRSKPLFPLPISGSSFHEATVASRMSLCVCVCVYVCARAQVGRNCSWLLFDYVVMQH
jgi:hypothetical protein